MKIDVYNNVNATTASAAYAYAAIAKTVDGTIVNLSNVLINVNVGNTTPSTTVPITTESTTVTTTVAPITTVQKVTTTERTTTTSVTTTTTKPRENKGLLKEINSKIVTINLEDNVYEYTVNVIETLEELDLVPVANDEKTKIEISSQKISELKDKRITINLSNNSDKEEYIIKVNTVPKPTVKPVTIDNSEFVEKNGYKVKWIVVIVLLGTGLILCILFLSNKKK